MQSVPNATLVNTDVDPVVDPVVDIVIVSWNTQALTLNCLHSLRQELALHSIPAAVWVVDNNSADGTVESIRGKFGEFHLIVNGDNVGFARANNQAIPLGTAPWVLLLNSDTVVPTGELRRLLEFATARSDVDVIGPKLIYENGAPQTSVDTVTTPLAQLAYLVSFYFPPFDNQLRKWFRKRTLPRPSALATTIGSTEIWTKAC